MVLALPNKVLAYLRIQDCAKDFYEECLWKNDGRAGCADGYINVSYYVDKYVEPKPKQQPASTQSAAAEIAKGLAKSIFKKLF